MPQLVPIVVEKFNCRWKYMPTWRAHSVPFAHLGTRHGYTRSQAELRLLIAIVIDVLVGERVRDRKART